MIKYPLYNYLKDNVIFYDCLFEVRSDYYLTPIVQFQAIT